MGKIEDVDRARRARAKSDAKGGSSVNEPAKSGPSTRGRCPICRKPAVEKYRPFCSVRCADIDLGRWIGGDYRVAGTPANALNSEDEDGETEG
jgi:uncharacterized protein